MSLVCVEKGQMFVPLGMSKFSRLLMALLATAVSEAAVSQMAAPALAGPVVCTTPLKRRVLLQALRCCLWKSPPVVPRKPDPHCSIGGCTPGRRTLPVGLI